MKHPALFIMLLLCTLCLCIAGTGLADGAPETEPTEVSIYVAVKMAVPEELTGPSEWNYLIEVLPEGDIPEAEQMIGTIDQDTDNGQIEFGPITYTEAGVYTYLVREDGTVDGVINDEDATTCNKTVTVTVVDNGDGTLTATSDSTAEEPLLFTNVYQVEPVTDNPVFGVVYLDKTTEDGRGHTFSFTLSAENAPLPLCPETHVHYDAGIICGKDIAFGEITYETPGVYTYTITENTTNYTTENGWSVVNNPLTVTVTVTDNTDGTLSVNVDVPEIRYEYNAEVTVDTANIDTLFGEIFLERTAEDDKGHTFSFALSADDAPMPEDIEAYVYFDAGRTGKKVVSFGKITYTAAGTYYYTITEECDGNGWTVASNPQFVEVVISDKGDGSLMAASVTPIIISIEYRPEPVRVWFPVKKVMNVPDGMSGPEDWEYEISVEALDGAPEANVMSGIVTRADDTIWFGDFRYSNPGIYEYIVRENGDVSGVINDGDAYNGKIVTVAVADNGDGTLTAAADSTIDDPLTFTNTYDAPVGNTRISVTVETEIPDGMTGPSECYYNITVTAEDGAPVAEEMTGTIDFNGTISFGPIEVNKPGSYSYTVTEEIFAAGVIPVTSTDQTVTAIVKDDGLGNLFVTFETGIYFRNTYSVEPVTASFPVKKVMSVPDGISGPEGWDYEISVEALDGAPEAGVMSGSVTRTNDTIWFGDFTYTKPGTYDYIVRESGTTAGVINDGDADGGKIVTVTVEDNGDGTLTADTGLTVEDPLTFTNTYTPATAKAYISITAETEIADGMTGPSEWCYDISVTAEDGAPAADEMEGTIISDGTIEIGPITFTEAGTYHYTVTEGTDAMIVTPDSQTATVIIEDDGNGSLVVTSVTDIVFTNTYCAESVLTFIPVTVETEIPDGLTGPSECHYDITVQADGDAPAANEMTGTIDFDGTVAIGPITFTKPGSYSYTVTEEICAAGVTNVTPAVQTVTVVVVDNGEGNLAVTSETGILFINAYGAEPATVSFPVKKVMSIPDGMSGPEDWDYEISVEALDGAPEADVMSGSVTRTNDTITFGDFTYTIPGTYEYIVRESGNAASVTDDIDAYDGKTVTVTVEDNGDGTMTAVADSTIENPLTFTNIYKAAPVEAYIPVSVEMEIPEGMTGPSECRYDITVTAMNNAPEAYWMTDTIDRTGSIVIGPITFTTAGSYTYSVSENGYADGVTNDEEADGKTVTIVVRDDGEGALVIDEEVTAVTFTNSYAAAGYVNPANEATPFGRFCLDRTTGDGASHDFTFTLSAENGTPMPEETRVSINYISFEPGEKTIPFGWITYEAVGEYTYTITEDVTNYQKEYGWEVTGNPLNVQVRVWDNGDGTLGAEVIGGMITNRYEADVTVNTGAAETSFGKIDVIRTTEDGQGHTFSFMMSADGDAPMPEREWTSVYYAGGVTGEEVLSFGNVTYTATGTYYYTIYEDFWGEGWRVPNSSLGVEVTVTDNGDGTLSASVSSGTFINEYYAEPVPVYTADEDSTFSVICMDKTTEDGQGHEFSFTLSAVGDAPLPECTQANVSFGSGVTGEKNINFGWITYTAAGTYEYTITEDDCGDWWKITGSPLTVTVEVTDNGNGTRSASVTGGTITNRYEAEVIVNPAESGSEFGLFNLTRTTEDGEGHTFNFTLSAADGMPMPETSQVSVSYEAGETGTKAIPFGTITYTATGMYEYTISEVQEDYTAINGWSILNSPATVMVEVTDNGDGTLTASISGGEIKNEYNAGLTAGVPCIISAASGYRTYVCYTAETAGVYSIAADTGITTLVSVYDELDGKLSELYVNDNYIDALPFQAGETRYFSFQFADGYTDGSLSVQIEPIGFLTQLNENETATAVIEENKQTYFMFTPAESGNYCFTSLSDKDTLGILYRLVNGRIISAIENDDGGENTNFLLPFTAKAGETVYFSTRFLNDPIGEFSVIVEPYEGLVIKPVMDSYMYQVYGQSSTLTVEASSGRGGVTWTWLRWEDGLYTPVDSVEGNSFTVPADIDKETKYACYVSDGTESYIHEFYVNPTDEFLDVHAADYNNNPSVPLGGSVDLTVTAVTASNMHSYQWFKTIETEYGGEIVVCMESIPGAVNDTYCVEGIEKATRYICRVTSPLNQAFQDVIFDVQVSCGITAEAATEQYTTVAAGSQATMRVHTETESSVPITYKWEKLRENGTWELIDGAEGDTYTAENIQRNSEYHCTVYNGYNFAGVDFLIYVENNVSAWAANGGYDSIVAGESCELAVNTHSDDADTEFSYQWYGPVSKDNEEGEAIAGATESVLAVSSVQHNAVYYCVVTDQNHFCNRVNFRISVESDLTAEASSDPWQYITIGDTAELSVNASCSAGEVFYQWYGPLTEWQNEYDADIIDGAVSATYQISQWKSPHDCYLCVVSDPYGNTIPVWFYAEVFSNLYAHSLDFNDWIPVGYGQGTTLAVEVESFGDVTYQWYRQTAINEYSSWLMPVEGGTGAELTIASVTEPVSYECQVTDPIGTAHTVVFHLFIDNELQITEDETEVYVRADEPATLSVTASCISGEISYQWYTEVHDDYGNTAFRPLEGETGTTLVISRHESNGRRFCCKAQDMTGDIVTSNPFTIWVDNGFFAEAADREVSAVPGGNVTLTVNTTSYDGTIDYTWYLDGNVVPGATGSSYTIENANRRAEYRCHVQDRFGNGTDVWFTLTIDNGFTASAAEEFLTVIPGQSAEMTVEASSNDGGEFSYQWVMYDPHFDENDNWQEWRQIDGATGSTYTSEAIFEGTQFYCQVQDQYGNTRDVPFTVSIDNHLTVTSVQENMTAEPDGTVTMEAEAHCEVGSITYQWYRQVFDTDENGYEYESWALIDGATETSYTSEAIAQPTQYCCNVQDEYGTGLSAYFYITVDNHFCAEAAETSLTAAPNETATMQVNAECMKGGLSYQWYKYDPYTDEDNIWHEFRQIEGVTDATCISEAITQYTYYRCDVRDDYGNVTAVEFYISIDNHLTVTVEQNNLTAAPNEQVTMTVNAQCDVGALSYQWYLYAPYFDEFGNEQPFMKINGATGASYTSEPITQSTWYHCVVTDEYGSNGNADFSISIDNHLTAEPVQDRLTVSLNEQATMAVNAGCEFGSLSYQWYKFDPNSNEYGNWNESMLIEEATEAAYTSEPITGYTGYHCIIHDEYGCETFVDFYVTIENHLTAGAVQGIITVSHNETAYMEVTAGCDIGGITYQWHRLVCVQDELGYECTFWEPIEGETGRDFTSPEITKQTQYYCDVYDEYGNSVGVTFYIYVENHLTAAATQENLTVAPNETVTMQVTAQCDAGSLYYQWYKHDPCMDEYGNWQEFVEIEGATEAIYTSEPIAQYTWYYCDVMDEYSNHASVNFYITVENHLTATGDQNEFIISPEETVTMEVSASCDAGSIQYQWNLYGLGADEWGNEYEDWWPIEGTTEATYTTGPITRYMMYRCVVRDEYGNATSVDFYVSVDNHFMASAVQQSQLVIPNTSATMEVEASCDVGSISYQWHGFEPWVDEWGNECEIQIPIDGATEAVYISEPITGYTHYYCHVQDECGNAIGVEFFASIDNQFSAEAIDPDKTVAPNETVVMEVNAHCAAGNITYQWYQYISGDDYWVAQVIEGATGASYTIDEITKNSEYYCLVQDEYGSSNYVTFHILVENHFTAEAVQSSLKVPLNETVTIEVNASCMEGDITYWWYKYERFTDDYGNWHEGFKRIQGAEGAAYTCEAITDNARYLCYVQDAYGNGASIDFHVTVDSHLTAEATASNLTATPNTSVSMEVTASCDVGPLTYVWMKYVRDVDEWGNEIGNWVLIEGATEAALTSEPITGYTMYRCSVQDIYGNSDEVWFYISIENHLIAEAVNDNLTVVPNTPVTLEVQAACDVGSITYQWSRYDKGVYDEAGNERWDYWPIEGATESTLSGTVTSDDKYCCTVRDEYGSEKNVRFNVICENHFTAKAAEEDIYAAPYAAVTMQVNAECDVGSLTYQWYRDSYTDEDGNYHEYGPIEGADDAALTIEEISTYSRYFCYVHDEYGHSEHVWFYMHVINHLTASTAQSELTVNYNQAAILEVNASCDDNALTYRWYRGNYIDDQGWWHEDAFIEGATGATYTTEPITQFSWYYCDVLDQYGNVDNVNFNITVENHFTAEAVQNELIIQPGETVSLEVRASCDNGSVIYSWYKSEYIYEYGEWNPVRLDTAPNQAVYVTEPLTNYAEYMCMATDQYGKQIYIDFFVGIDNNFVAGTHQEERMDVVPGDEVTMEVYASCNKGDITYQWYINKYDKLTGWVRYEPITGATGASFTSDPVTEYTMYYCHVEDAYRNSRNIYFDLAIWNEPIYLWTEDFGSVTATCTAKGRDEITHYEMASTTYQVTVSPTATVPGKAVYTANFFSRAFGQQQKERTIPATNEMATLSLPGQIRNIEEEAFAGGTFQAVVIPDGCTSIGSRAFADCENLRYVRIPASVTSLADDAFEGCGQVLIDDQRGN